ncbi:MAG: 16S rRNA (cytidine(1402)-2'-O)-methyltransferase, partial [Chloroflexi bacterium]|nr:16S rRNA (cytidine(1402)-2'-O)-methyltransferase [Chloroflexota bacterium]
MPGTLYVVATPIGNLEDLTYRAARVLGEVALVVAEDTRQTRKLLTHLGLHKPLLSYNEHNAAQRTPRVLDALGAGDVALVSDAGTPLVSDPGAGLVRAAAEA